MGAPLTCTGVCESSRADGEWRCELPPATGQSRAATETAMVTQRQGLVEATEEEKDADTWITPKPRRRCRKPVSSRPNQEQAEVERDRDRAVATATRCCKNPFNTLRSEHTQTSGSDTGSEISETGSNKAPHVTPGSVDDII
ncbi:hypothetical protein NDU88_000914 [Pleurodeles waltl]|uniref:Uncharacterized protein n=1 Tax=Pleurodeles waltl TaxID=8319 RepID=A0AAV7U7U5_PLEWA|nr:hypothetical protein NDU88_000914 [Pleurodeles waltl]